MMTPGSLFNPSGDGAAFHLNQPGGLKERLFGNAHLISSNEHKMTHTNRDFKSFEGHFTVKYLLVQWHDLNLLKCSVFVSLAFSFIRELFFISTENHLLRAKILELIFLNSCERVPALDLPLSLGKILHFIGNSMLLLENQGPAWQRWDEILHHICLLFLSLQRIMKDHLLTPITDRTDAFCQRPRMQSTDITESDVEQCLLLFWSRTAIGSDVCEEFKDRFFMLRALLLAAVKNQNP